MHYYLDTAGLQDFALKLTAKNKTLFAEKSLEAAVEELRAAVGSPLVAEEAADMTDTDKIYVYVGSEEGYTAGDWYYYDGSVWQDGGVYNSTAFVTDATLSVAGMAADAAVTGNGIREAQEFLKEVVPYPYAMTWISGKAIYADTGLSYDAEYFSASGFVDLGSAEAIRYTRLYVSASGPAHGIAFYNASKTYISGERSLGGAESSTMVETVISVPAGAQYARFTKRNAETEEYTVYDNGQYTGSMKASQIVDESDIAKLKTDVAAIDTVVQPVSLPYTLTEGYYVKYADGAGASSESFSLTNYIPLDGISKIRYIRVCVTSSSPQHGMAFYNSGKTYISGVQSGKNAAASSNQWYEVSVPANAAYARFTYWAAAGRETRGDFAVYDVSQAEASLTERVSALEETAVNITHAKPPTAGHLNVVRRCRQFTDIKWTPAVDLPRRSQMSGDTVGTTSPVFEDVFEAGVEYTGIPYARATRDASSWGYDDMKVGWTVGFDTFISAAMNPESVVAMRSQYNAGAHNACFYATVCAAVCSYAYNLDKYYTAEQLPSAPGISKIGNISDLALTDIQMGDMLLDPTAHGAIVTDLVTDGSGDVTYIEISEATTIGNDNWNVTGSQLGGLCRRRMWSAADFRVKWNGYGLYRYANIASVPYTRSAYVNTGDEGDTLRVINFPVIPYMGEGFRYIVGKIVNTKILTPAYKEGYTDKLRVKKDGVDWNTNGTTDYYDVSGAYVEVGFSAAGDYEAYLCQVSDGVEVIKTRSCHWTVEAAE